MNGYNSLFGFSAGFGIGDLQNAVRSSTNYFVNSHYNWDRDPSYLVNAWGIIPYLWNPYDSTLIWYDSIYKDMNDLISTIPGTDPDTVCAFWNSFDFISGGTYFDLTYVFASDEYTKNIDSIQSSLVSSSSIQFVNNINRIMGIYNDGVGIFLSGPGINGSYSKHGENVAVVPGTNLPVSVRTIRPIFGTSEVSDTGSHVQLYNSNTSNSQFILNGYTDNLTLKKIQINPCDTYKVYLAVSASGETWGISTNQNYPYPSPSLSLTSQSCDAASAIIVKKHSAHTGFWQPAPLQLYDGYGKDTLVEGCPGVLMRFVRFFHLNQPDSIHLMYEGSATWGVDYDSLPEWVFFQPGQDTLEFLITPTPDSNVEGIESLVIRLMPPGVYECPVDTTEVELWIADRPPFNAVMADTFFFDPCATDSITIGPDTIEGLAPVTYLWSTGQTTPFINVAPLNNQGYSLTVYDACQFDSIVLTTVTRTAPAPEIAFINNDSTINCAQGLLPIGFKVLANYYPQFEYKWETGEVDSIIYVNPLENGTYTYNFKILRPCMPDSFEYSITVHVENDPIIVQLDDINEVHCPGFTYDLNPTVSGGYLPYAYAWSTSENSLNIQVAPLETDTYFFSVSDVCGLDTIVGRSIVHVPNYDSLDIIGIKRIDLPCPIGYVTIHPDQYIGKGGMSGTTQKLYTFSWDNWKTTGKALQFFTDKDSLLTLRMRDTCNVDEAILEVNVSVFHGPYLSATFPDTLHVCLGDPVILKPDVQDGVPPYTYLWTNGSSDSVKAIVQSEALRSYQVTVSDFCDFHEEKTALVKATRPVAGYEAMNDSYDPLLVSFDNQSTGAVMYSWYFGDQTTSIEENPQLHLETLSQTQVKLVVEDRYGCQDSIDGMLDIPLNLFIPNAFTPNGDFLNETWIPLGYGFETLEYTIFDRWGNEVYQCNRPECFEWNGSSHGTLLPSDTYSYLLIVKPINQREQQVRGQVTLVR